jgi:predicted dehydrogenase
METEQPNKVRVGLIGTGFGQEHLTSLRSLPDVSVDWLAYGHDRKRAEALAAEYEIQHVTSEWQELISAPLTAVVIVTPVALHYPIARAALSAGKLVVCDKPLALNSAEAEELAQNAARKALPSMTFFQWRFHSGPRTLHKWLRSGIFGVVQQIDLQFRHDFLAAPTTNWPWRHRIQTAGSGAFGDLGVHLIDLLLWLTGEDFEVIGASTLQVWKERTLASDSNRGQTIICETEDAGQAWLRAVDGCVASIFVSRCAPEFRSIRIVVTGSSAGAILEIDPGSGSHVIQFRGPKEAQLPAEETSLAPYSVWLDAIRNDASAEIPTFADGARAQKILDHVLRAAAR